MFLEQVTDADGVAHADPAACSRLLAERWGGVFQRRSVNSDTIADLVSIVEPVPRDDYQCTSRNGLIHPWIIPENICGDSLASKKDACPGPDGLTHSAWQATGN
eukprot:9470407-Pyramimonas_sp.AAC.1